MIERVTIALIPSFASFIALISLAIKQENRTDYIAGALAIISMLWVLAVFNIW